MKYYHKKKYHTQPGPEMRFLTALLSALGRAITWPFRRRPKISQVEKERIWHLWQQVERKANSNNESEWKQAILDADKIIDHLLKLNQVSGEKMGDRLKNAREKFSNSQGVWEAHKLRNIITHEIDVKITQYEVRSAIANLRKAKKDLGM